VLGLLVLVIASCLSALATDTQMPNLTVEVSYLGTHNPPSGEAHQWQITLRNEGTAEACSFRVVLDGAYVYAPEFERDPIPYEKTWSEVGPLLPGATQALAFEIPIGEDETPDTLRKSGRLFLHVMADPDYAVGEPTKDDNRAFYTWGDYESAAAATLSVPEDAYVECDDSMSPESLGMATVVALVDTWYDLSVDYTDHPDYSCWSSSEEHEYVAQYRRVWSVTDAFGIEITGAQMIYVYDDTPPTFDTTFLPDPNRTYECNDCVGHSYASGVSYCMSSDSPWTDTGQAYKAQFYAALQDSCDCSLKEIYVDNVISDITLPDGRPAIRVTRTWTGEDQAGNQTSHVETLTFTDTEAPVWIRGNGPRGMDGFYWEDGAVIERELDCADDFDFNPSSPDTYYLCDCCDESPSLKATVTEFPGTCAGTKTVTVVWVASDQFGNSTTATEIFTVVDKTEPTVFPPDTPAGLGTYLSCSESIHPDNTGWALAEDDCDPDPSLSYEDEYLDVPNGGTIIERRWVAEDACGNVSETVYQEIHLEAPADPLGSVAFPPDVRIADGSPTDPDHTGGWATVTDLCARVKVQIEYMDDLSLQQPGILERRWVARLSNDPTGNQRVEHVQKIEIVDTFASAVVSYSTSPEVVTTGEDTFMLELAIINESSEPVSKSLYLLACEDSESGVPVCDCLKVWGSQQEILWQPSEYRSFSVHVPGTDVPEVLQYELLAMTLQQASEVTWGDHDLYRIAIIEVPVNFTSPETTQRIHLMDTTSPDIMELEVTIRSDLPSYIAEGNFDVRNPDDLGWAGCQSEGFTYEATIDGTPIPMKQLDILRYCSAGPIGAHYVDLYCSRCGDTCVRHHCIWVAEFPANYFPPGTYKIRAVSTWVENCGNGGTWTQQIQTTRHITLFVVEQ